MRLMDGNIIIEMFEDGWPMTHIIFILKNKLKIKIQ